MRKAVQCDQATPLGMAHLSRSREMAKLRFDPVTYQFYYQCPPQEGAPAKAAGFGWDPIRRRYYTEYPMVAMALARRGDNFFKHLLDAPHGATASYSHPESAGRTRIFA